MCCNSNAFKYIANAVNCLRTEVAPVTPASMAFETQPSILSATISDEMSTPTSLTEPLTAISSSEPITTVLPTSTTIFRLSTDLTRRSQTTNTTIPLPSSPLFSTSTTQVPSTTQTTTLTVKTTPTTTQSTTTTTQPPPTVTTLNPCVSAAIEAILAMNSTSSTTMPTPSSIGTTYIESANFVTTSNKSVYCPCVPVAQPTLNPSEEISAATLDETTQELRIKTSSVYDALADFALNESTTAASSSSNVST